MEVVALKKHYRKSSSLMSRDKGIIKALNNVSFVILQNEILGIVGESGCGKSTLSRQLVRLENATAGKIMFQGEDILKYRGSKLKTFRRSCQIIFQDSLSALNPSFRIRDLLSEPLDNYFNLNWEEKNSKIMAMLERVKLKRNILDRFPHTLSGGERQRVNICRALFLEPKLLICDEIVSNLDVLAQALILQLLKDLNKELKMALLFISHDIRVVRYICDRIIVMQAGQIVEVIDNKDTTYRITHPYTKKLFASLPVSHPDKRGSVCFPVMPVISQ